MAFRINSMDPVELAPKRSRFWFSKRPEVREHFQLINGFTLIICISLAVLPFVILWPTVSAIRFEEAFFTPLIPFIIEVIGGFGVSPNDALRGLFMLSFVLVTVGIYLLVLDLTKRQVSAILAAVIFLVPPIPIFVLSFSQSGVYAQEVASARSFFGIVYGDGAHFLALALIPYAILFFLRYLRDGKQIDFLSSISACALILLANRSQSLNLFLALGVSVIVESLLGQARLKIKRFLAVLIFSLGLISFWYTPDFWFAGVKLFVVQAAQNIKFLFPLPLTLFVFALVFSFVFFARKQQRRPIFISSVLFIVFFTIVFEWFSNGHSFVPHPYRLISNLNMFGGIVLALFLTDMMDRFKLMARFGIEKWSGTGQTLGILVFGLISLVALTFAAYILSPLAILAVAGHRGIWTVTRMEILADRHESLNLAGGSFKLIVQNVSEWQLFLSYGLSLFFLFILVIVVIKKFMIEEN